MTTTISRQLRRLHLQRPRLAKERAEMILQVEAAEKQKALEKEMREQLDRQRQQQQF